LSVGADDFLFSVVPCQFSQAIGWGGASRGRKLIGRNLINLIVSWSWCGPFLFFVVPYQFSQDNGEWPENQILIPDWTYLHCPGATLLKG